MYEKYYQGAIPSFLFDYQLIPKKETGKMITLDQVKNLHYGQILHHVSEKNSDGTPMRFKVVGNVKTWKRDTNRIRVPLKRGLYETGELTNGTWEGGRYTLYLEHVSLA